MPLLVEDEDMLCLRNWKIFLTTSDDARLVLLSKLEELPGSLNKGLMHPPFNLVVNDFFDTLHVLFFPAESLEMQVKDRLRLPGDAFGVSGSDSVEGIEEASDSTAAFNVFWLGVGVMQLSFSLKKKERVQFD